MKRARFRTVTEPVPYHTALVVVWCRADGRGGWKRGKADGAGRARRGRAQQLAPVAPVAPVAPRAVWYCTVSSTSSARHDGQASRRRRLRSEVSAILSPSRSQRQTAVPWTPLASSSTAAWPSCFCFVRSGPRGASRPRPQSTSSTPRCGRRGTEDGGRADRVAACTLHSPGRGGRDRNRPGERCSLSGGRKVW